jgi:protein-S-isoprenylcysteine O-methyltransferase Ste14
MTRLLKKYYAFFRIFYIIISFVLLIPLINFTSQLDSNIIVSYGPVLTWVRYVLTCGALLMFFWAFFFNYDSLSFFGIRQILNFANENESSSSVGIKKKGLLGITRHPMYLALIIYLWCNVFTTADIIVSALLTIYVLIGTILEEKKLVLEFGKAYEDYQHEVPMLIPYLNPGKSQQNISI